MARVFTPFVLYLFIPLLPSLITLEINYLESQLGDFPADPGARTLRSQHRSLGSVPGERTGSYVT